MICNLMYASKSKGREKNENNILIILNKFLNKFIVNKK